MRHITHMNEKWDIITINKSHVWTYIKSHRCLTCSKAHPIHNAPCILYIVIVYSALIHRCGIRVTWYIFIRVTCCLWSYIVRYALCISTLYIITSNKSHVWRRITSHVWRRIMSHVCHTWMSHVANTPWLIHMHDICHWSVKIMSRVMSQIKSHMCLTCSKAHTIYNALYIRALYIITSNKSHVWKRIMSHVCLTCSKARTLLCSRPRLYASPDTCDMSHSQVWHGSFICRTWLIHMCDMAHSCAWHDSFKSVTWLVHMCDMQQTAVVLVPRHLRHDSFRCSCICVPWLTRMCNMIRAYMWHDSCIYVVFTRSCVWHDSFICVTWLVHMCEMTHSYV